jgi:large conductance mechanosensitive channel
VKIPNPKIVVEFREFLLKTNMFALAMGVVLGAAVKDLVTAIVSDWIMPILSVVLPNPQYWNTWTLSVWRLHFPLGHFFSVVLMFVVIAAVVFFITKLMMKFSPPPPAVPTKVCPQCLEAVHVDAKKCKFCTSPF